MPKSKQMGAGAHALHQWAMIGVIESGRKVLGALKIASSSMWIIGSTARLDLLAMMQGQCPTPP